MESLELVATFILAFTLSLALYHRRRRQQLGRVALTPSIKVRDHAVAHQALIDHGEAFANRPPSTFPVRLITGRRRRRQSHGITTVPYGPHWRVLRSNVTATILQPWRQGLLAPLQQDAVDALIAGLVNANGSADDGVVILRDSLYTTVFAMFSRVCFGDDVDALHMRSIERMMRDFLMAVGEARIFARSAMARFTHWSKWRRFRAFRGQQVELFVPLIAARRRHKDDGDGAGGGGGGGVQSYVDSLIDLRVPQEDDPQTKRALTDDEMVSLIVENLSAVDSIVAILEWTLAHLVTQPEVHAKLRHEIAAAGGGGGSTTYLHAVVLECLRLHPPFPMVMRQVRSESEGAVVGAAAVPAGGMRVQFMLGNISKDKRLWTDPDDFRPERFLPGGEGEDVALLPVRQKQIRMMPFGAGHRACPAAAMGLQLIKGFLTALVREFEWAAPPGDGGVDMTELYGFINVMKSPLRARVTPCA